MNLIINIKNNAISGILAKKNLHTLNEIKKTEIRNKRLISSQKKLINFFNELLEAIYFVKKEKIIIIIIIIIIITIIIIVIIIMRVRVRVRTRMRARV